MSDSLKLSIVQMTSVDRPEENLMSIEKAYLTAVEQGADLAVFPENSVFLRIQAGAPTLGLSSEQIARLEELTRTRKTSLMLTTPIANGDGKFRNSTFLFNPGEKMQEVYAKVHLFDVDVDGAPSVRESATLVPGTGPKIIDFRGWKIGLSICYDVRFSELFSNYAQKTDLIFVPSAFLVPTGEAHWHTLLRARAIECQAYVAAPAQCGAHSAAGQTRRTYGHSLVVDPWGKVLGELDGGPDVLTLELQREEITKVRKQIPMARHRRLTRD
jgi:deaminated glutathione amidase